MQILPFNHAALQRFRNLRRAHRRLGTNDLRIAAIALAHGAVLVSRNLIHFSVLKGLGLEDWAAGIVTPPQDGTEFKGNVNQSNRPW